MIKGINRITLIGTVAKDPKVLNTNMGIKVAEVSLTTTESWIDKTTRIKESLIEWHHLVFFGKLAELVEQYVKKGSLLYSAGPKRTRKFITKDNIEKDICEIMVKEFQILNKIQKEKPIKFADEIDEFNF